MNEDELKKLLMQQAHITCIEVAKICADFCDKNRGHLSVGDMIRSHFKLNEIKEEEKKSHIRRIK